ncbi:hypothetical protein K0651_02980 [Ornithinimicrobium sp. Arc0846-15]|nr:hypothetical protein [Ornithinimicrobium laminariae]
MDGGLSSAGLASVDAHLAVCSACTNFVDQLRATINLPQETPGIEIANDLRDALSEALATLNDAGTAEFAAQDHTEAMSLAHRKASGSRSPPLGPARTRS